MRRRGPRALVLATIITTLAAGLPVGQAQAAPARFDPGRTGPVRVSEPTRTITLITGDQVTVHSGNLISIAAGPGRAGVTFLRRQIGTHRYVIPSDALPLLSADRVDRRLFDVDTLVAAGYDDRAGELPLLVAYQGKGSRAADGVRAAVAVDGARVVRDLPAIDALAVRATRAGRPELWHALTVGTRTLRPGVAKLWLDGKRKVNLDVSVPQIGAPAAWRVGLDGTGVTVAVLDTGIDATHPDLADRIVGSANFTDAPDTDDLVGHGTHVASTIAGSGVASGGRYRGVAPGAKLLNGKVCPDESCTDSSVIAGMQWAVQQGAQVVNLSLGGPDTPGLDPLEQAVQELTAASDTLFVIAAGNDGADASVNSPASADAALAVGAVDRNDQLAPFSSRGPRVGDNAIKPDITAPGVGIVAAKAAHGQIGDPGPVAGYVSLSGTSMATPHVAGAAAILTQQHPDWSPEQRKFALMAAAKPTPGLSVYDQGAGRVDVARAITQQVTAGPAAVGFGAQAWPHNDDIPTIKTVTYRNSGPTPVTLALSAPATGPGGVPAPAGAFTLSADTVTVPAGGTGAVRFTADTRVGGPDGRYSGYLTATAGGGVQVQTPFVVDREVESYNVTFVPTGRDGAPANEFVAELVDPATGKTYDSDSSRPITVRVPKGDYGLDGWIFTGAFDDPARTSTLLAQPKVRIAADTTLNLDARVARPISVTLPRKGPELFRLDAAAQWSSAHVSIFTGLTASRFGELFMGRLGPDRAVDGFLSLVGATFARPSPDGYAYNSPYTYNLLWHRSGGMFTGFHRAVRNQDLVTIKASYSRTGDASMGSRTNYGLSPGTGFGFGYELTFDLPFRRTEYVNADDGLRWLTRVDDVAATPDGPLDRFNETRQNVRYRAGRSYVERWNTPVFAPSVANAPADVPDSWASRTGDEILSGVPLYSDGQGREGVSTFTGARTALYRNGTLLGETADTFGQFAVPPGRASYRLEMSAERGAPQALSTRVQAAWTFTSRHVAGQDPRRLPLSTVRFSPPLNPTSTAPAGRTFAIAVTVDRLADSAATANRRLTVQVSYDDGRTWQQATVRGHGAHRVAVVRHPGTGGYASLRAVATDTAGNTVTQTVLRAYRIG